MYENDNYGSEGNGTNKETWRRQLHLLNLITYGQTVAIQGKTLQNPYYVAVGCSIILEVIGPLMKEEKVYATHPLTGEQLLDDKNKPVVIAKLKGIQSPTYKRFFATLIEINNLIQVSLQPGVTNRGEVLSKAFGMAVQLQNELLQKVSDYGLDFKEKTDRSEAYRDEE